MLAGLGTLSTKSPRNERLLYDFYHRMQSRSVLFARREPHAAEFDPSGSCERERHHVSGRPIAAQRPSCSQKGTAAEPLG